MTDRIYQDLMNGLNVKRVGYIYKEYLTAEIYLKIFLMNIKNLK